MADRARIVQLTTVHHPLDPRIYLKQARSLANAGFDVWLLARGAGLTSPASEFEDVTFVPLPGGRARMARLRRQAVASREIRRIKPDVIHVHDPELLPLARRLKRSLGAKVIYDKHEDYGGRKGIEGKALAALENYSIFASSSRSSPSQYWISAPYCGLGTWKYACAVNSPPVGVMPNWCAGTERR